MNRDEVSTAFEILLEEIEVATNAINEQGAAAFRMGEYEKARAAIEHATRLADFREKVKALQKEWVERFSARPSGQKTRKKKTERLPRGLRTPDDAFRRPILETLVELGGSAPVEDVLSRVEQKMKHQLNEYDYQTLPSDRRTIRWRNTAQWCRYTLVREGLMVSDSGHGIWTISDKGREWLEKNRNC